MIAAMKYPEAQPEFDAEISIVEKSCVCLIPAVREHHQVR
jgi:hypothetical protein